MVMQSDALGSGTMNSNQAGFMGQGNVSGMFSEAGVLDPTILHKGIATIKEQMKDVQREALNIETEMEKRFSDMMHKNS